MVESGALPLYGSGAEAFASTRRVQRAVATEALVPIIVSVLCAAALLAVIVLQVMTPRPALSQSCQPQLPQRGSRLATTDSWSILFEICDLCSCSGSVLAMTGDGIRATVLA